MIPRFRISIRRYMLLVALVAVLMLMRVQWYSSRSVRGVWVLVYDRCVTVHQDRVHGRLAFILYDFTRYPAYIPFAVAIDGGKCVVQLGYSTAPDAALPKTFVIP